MAGNFMRLYSQGAEPSAAYLLENGKVFMFLSDQDKYGVSGKNIIIGSAEIIMNHYMHKSATYTETALAPKDSSIKKISKDKFIAGMNNFSFAMNTAMVLAKQVKETSKIIRAEKESLEGKKVKQKEDAIMFYLIISRLMAEFDKRKLPWLNEIIGDKKNSLMFKKGEAYQKSEEPVTLTSPSILNDKDVEYERGGIICEEGDDGNDMFILKSGAIDVLVGGNKVAMIDTPGMVIGEMALLLGEKRSATLRAGNRIVITRVTKGDLKNIAHQDMVVVQTIAQALAKRQFYNTYRITSINESLAERAFVNKTKDVRGTPLDKGHLELRNLKTEVEEAVGAKNGDFLEDLVNSF
jgi:CRP-like cAMP-binding protein